MVELLMLKAFIGYFFIYIFIYAFRTCNDIRKLFLLLNLLYLIHVQGDGIDIFFSFVDLNLRVHVPKFWGKACNKTSICLSQAKSVDYLILS